MYFAVYPKFLVRSFAVQLPIKLAIFVGCFACLIGMSCTALAKQVETAQQVEAAQQLPAPQPPAKQYRYWKTNWSFDSVDVGNVLQRLRQVGISIPIQADGDVTVKFSVSVPINALRTGRAYKFSGALSSNQLQLEQLLLADLRTQVSYENGRLDFTDLSMRWLDRRVALRQLQSEIPNAPGPEEAGTLAGDAAFQLIPLGLFTTNLDAKSLSIAPVYDLITKATGNADIPLLSGSVSGGLAVRGPLSEFGEIENWTINANLRGEDLSIKDSPPLTIATGPLTLENSELRADNIALGSPIDPSVRLSASVVASLQQSMPVSFGLRGNDVPLQTLLSLGSLGSDIPVTGKLDVDLNGKGSLNPEGPVPSWEISGRLATPDLMVYGVQLGLIEHVLAFNQQRFSLEPIDDSLDPATIIESIAADYSITDEGLRLASLEASVFQGAIAGEAFVSREESGIHRLDLQWQELRPKFDTRAFFPASVDLLLQTTGNIQWQVPADSVENLATHDGSLSIVVDPIALNDSSVGDLQAEVRASGGELVLDGSGNIFGGTFSVDTVAPLGTETTLSDLLGTATTGQTKLTSSREPLNTNLIFNKLDLKRLQTLVPRSALRYGGQISGTALISNNGGLSIEASLIANNLELDNKIISRRLTSDLSLQDGQLVFESLRGNYAGGRFEAVGGIDLSRMLGRLNVRLSSVDFARGMLLISPNVAALVGGAVSGRATVDIDDAIRVRGAVSVRDNEIFQIGTGQTHASLSVVLAKNLSSWSVDLRNVEGTLGRGRVRGELQLASSSLRRGAFDMESQWTAQRLNFVSLLSDFGSSNQYARGEIDGSLVLGGDGIRTVSDLRGRFDASLGGTQARAVPGLISAQAYLGAFALSGTTFEAGRARGTIGSGTIGLSEFWLISDQVRVWADGRIRVPSGRLDIAAVVQTGDFEAQNLALLSIIELAALPAGVPVGTIIRLNRLVSNRTLYFDVVGNLSRPRFRLKPLDILRQNAAQYIAREAAASIIPFSTPSAVLSFDSND